MEPLRILMVCTANACRSPVAERLFERELAAFGVPAVVTSAGTRGGTIPVHRHTIEAARSVDIDLRDHAPRQLTAEMLGAEGKDLVLAMTREHVIRIVTMDENVFERTFTLPELSRRARVNGVNPLSTRLPDWLTSISEGRTREEVMTAGSEADLADPYGSPLRFHRMMVGDVDAFINSIVPILAASIDSNAD